MMRERRFEGDTTRIRSPPRVEMRGGREYSPPRGQSRYLGTISPARGSVRGQDYLRDLRTRSPARETGDYSRSHHDLPGSSSISRASVRGRDFLQDFRTGSPTRETGDYSRSRHGLPGSSAMSGERERPSGSRERSDYGRHLDGDRDRQVLKLSPFNEGLPQGGSPSLKFQWNQLLDESKRTNGVSHRSKHYSDYGVSITSTRMSTERSYQGSGFADRSHSGMRVEKPLRMEIERDRNIPSLYPLQSDTRRSFGTDGGGLLLPSQKLNMGLHKNEDLRFEDQMSTDKFSGDKLSARDLYKEEEIPKFYSREENLSSYSRDTSRYVIPSSQSKALSSVPFESSMDYFHDSRGDGLPVHSDGFNRNSGMLAEPVPRKAYTHVSYLKSSRDPDLQLEGRQVQLSPIEGTHGGYTYPDVRRNQKSEMASLYDKLYGKMVSIQDDYGHRDSFSSRILEPIKDRMLVTEGSRREHLIEGTLWDQYHTSQEQPMSNCPDAAGSSYTSNKDGEALDQGSLNLAYERDISGGHGYLYMREDHDYGRDASLEPDDERLDVSLMTEYDLGLDGVENNGRERFAGEELHGGHGSIYMGEDHGYGRDAGLEPDDERFDTSLMTEYDSGFDGVDNNHREAFTWEELHIEQPKRTLKRKLGVETKLSRQNPRGRFSSNRKISGKIHDTSSNPSPLNSSRYRNVGRTSNDVGHRYSNSVASDWPSECNPRQLNYNVRDIKKRLGPRVTDIKKRLGPLQPVPQHVHKTYPWVKNREVQKLLARDQDGHHGSIHAEEEGRLEGNLPPAKSEPPENSEGFKQLVQDAFFKFVKQLNENPAQRRRLKEQQKGGSLKCSVCGRDSEEFRDTESLVMHSCTAAKVGLRAQHLGLHKALCSLMGWKSAETLNSQWVRQLLPDTETVALKEDLIIWPPVVVVHNCSVGNIKPDERVIVSIQMLEAILRDMGFGEKTKVCRGKPANQSIMVVKFSGTFSGFQEAENLHKFYADNKHGRTEFLRINSNSSIDSGTQKAAAENVQQFLYGYLGIAEDLDKLDFEDKKRGLVRSKKEIQEIVNAPL